MCFSLNYPLAKPLKLSLNLRIISQEMKKLNQMVSETASNFEGYDSDTPENILTFSQQRFRIWHWRIVILALSSASKLAFGFFNFQICLETNSLNNYVKKYHVHKHLRLKNEAKIYAIYNSTNSTEHQGFSFTIDLNIVPFS